MAQDRVAAALSQIPDKRLINLFLNMFRYLRLVDLPSTVGINAGSTLSLVPLNHAGRVISLNAAAGSVVTLPAATGTGEKYKFLVSAIATSNSHVVKVANATDFMIGSILGVSDDPATAKGWISINSGTVATNSDTVTLNRSTSGSVTAGEWFEVQDVSANTWSITGVITQNGTEVTPFTAGV